MSLQKGQTVHRLRWHGNAIYKICVRSYFMKVGGFFFLPTPKGVLFINRLQDLRSFPLRSCLYLTDQSTNWWKMMKRMD